MWRSAGSEDDPVRRRIVAVDGSVTYVVMAEGLPVRFDEPARSVCFLDDSLALVVFDGEFGDKNLLILGPAGDELARLGTTCGRGTVDQVLDVEGEIRVIEATPGADYQARLDLDTLTLERVAEWR